MKRYCIFILSVLIYACSFSSNEQRCRNGQPLIPEGINSFIVNTKIYRNGTFYDCIKKQQDLVKPEDLLSLAIYFQDMPTIYQIVNLNNKDNYEIKTAFTQAMGDLARELPREQYLQFVLGTAIVWGKPDAVQQAIDDGASVHKPIHGVYPINWAARTGNAKIVQVLLKNHADPTIYDEWGPFRRNTLIHAVFSNSPEVVKLILKQPQVKVDAPSWFSNSATDEVTPLMHAINANNIEIATLLLNAHANVNQHAIPRLSGKGFISDGTLDVLNGKYPLANDTPLSIAIRQSNLEMVKLLIRYGANVNKKYGNPDVNKPLDLAYEIGDDKITNFLLDKGAKRSDY